MLLDLAGQFDAEQHDEVDVAEAGPEPAVDRARRLRRQRIDRSDRGDGGDEPGRKDAAQSLGSGERPVRGVVLTGDVVEAFQCPARPVFESGDAVGVVATDHAKPSTSS